MKITSLTILALMSLLTEGSYACWEPSQATVEFINADSNSTLSTSQAEFTLTTSPYSPTCLNLDEPVINDNYNFQLANQLIFAGIFPSAFLHQGSSTPATWLQSQGFDTSSLPSIFQNQGLLATVVTVGWRSASNDGPSLSNTCTIGLLQAYQIGGMPALPDEYWAVLGKDNSNTNTYNGQGTALPTCHSNSNTVTIQALPSTGVNFLVTDYTFTVNMTESQ
jgi:hypothetical protein